MKILIAIMLLAGTISCDALDREKREIQLNACEEGFSFMSPERFEAYTNLPPNHDLDQFEYGDHITGHYSNDLKRSLQGDGRGQMSIFLSLTNTGEEDIPLALSMQLRSEDSVYFPNTYKTCDKSKCPEYIEGGTARVEIEGDSQENVTYFFDLDLLEELTLNMIVKVGKDDATETLIDTELIKVVQRSNCSYGGGFPALERVE